MEAQMILDQLLKIGFLTGSRAFGTNRDDSDYDIVFSIEDSSLVNDIIGKIEKTPSNYFAGYYIYDSGILINLIPVHPHEFLPWYLATKAMQSTLATSGMTSPIKKYAVFSGMVALYKGTVEELRNLGAYIELKEKILALEGGKISMPKPDPEVLF